MYVRPQVNDEPITLAVSGKLWRDALIMFDRETRSLWSQILGASVAGPLEGRELEEIPSQVTTWGSWRQRHPETLVLKKPRQSGSNYDDYFDNPRTIGVVGSRNPDPRLPVKTLVLGLEIGEFPLAIPFELLEKYPVLNSKIQATPLVVFSPPGEQTALVFKRTVDDRELSFAPSPEDGPFAARDDQTRSLWSGETGECLSGELKGTRLQPIEAVAVFWGVWARYHPGTGILAE